MRTVIPIIAILFCFCDAASAQQQTVHPFLNGDDLLANCTGYDTGYSMGECHGYIMGIIDAMGAGGALPHACIQGETSGELRDTIVGALQRDPASRHLPAAGVAAKALAQAYPCAAERTQ